MSYKVTILGCGNAAGTPSIGNFWGDCDPNEPKNMRSRPSVAVQSDKTTIIIDTGPDFRDQLNRENIKDIDAVLYTHAHGDHINGIDDLRMFFFRHDRNPVPIYGNMKTIHEINTRFHYVLNGGKHDIYPAIAAPNIINDEAAGQKLAIGDIEFISFEQDHGTCTSLGYRFDDFAYSTDMKNLGDQSLEALKGIKTWLVDGAGYKNDENAVHASFQNVFDLNKEIGAETVYFTHMSCFMDYKTILGELPDGYLPAYDGMVIST